jgi:hypothetical protein
MIPRRHSTGRSTATRIAARGMAAGVRCTDERQPAPRVVAIGHRRAKWVAFRTFRASGARPSFDSTFNNA